MLDRGTNSRFATMSRDADIRSFVTWDETAVPSHDDIIAETGGDDGAAPVFRCTPALNAKVSLWCVRLSPRLSLFSTSFLLLCTVTFLGVLSVCVFFCVSLFGSLCVCVCVCVCVSFTVTVAFYLLCFSTSPSLFLSFCLYPSAPLLL